MNKRNLIFLSLVVSVVAIPINASAAVDRWYAGVKSPLNSYAGIHSKLTTPSQMPYIDNTTLHTSSSMTLDWIEADGAYSDGSYWWVQTGYTLGWDNEAGNNPYYTVPEAFIEWGPQNNLNEYQYGPQPYGQTWDYWVRWDSVAKLWKVNINNLYTDSFAGAPGSGGGVDYPTNVQADAEINCINNGNGPARFSSNQYQATNGTWYSLSNDSNFKLYKDANTSYSYTGTVNDFTITK
ncbi:MAG: hypothetical protein ACXVDJ_00690 [Tumebacillaceae bacterium]